MKSTIQSLFRVSITLIVLAIAGCSGGRVTNDGVPLAFAGVTVVTCEDGSYHTTTDEEGVFEFNPYLTHSPNTDNSKFIPPGPILLWINDKEEGEYFGDWWAVQRDHQYTSTCDVVYNGSVQSVPCRLHQIDVANLEKTDPNYPQTPVWINFFQTCSAHR